MSHLQCIFIMSTTTGWNCATEVNYSSPQGLIIGGFTHAHYLPYCCEWDFSSILAAIINTLQMNTMSLNTNCCQVMYRCLSFYLFDSLVLILFLFPLHSSVVPSSPAFKCRTDLLMNQHL